MNYSLYWSLFNNSGLKSPTSCFIHFQATVLFTFNPMLSNTSFRCIVVTGYNNPDK